MKVAICGSSGYLAKHLIERIPAEVGAELLLKLGRSKAADRFIDLGMPGKFNYADLDDFDYVLFVAAVSGPDQCAAQFEYCWNVNVKGSSFFIRQAIEHNCKVLFFSSDAVFGSDSNAIYDENSHTRPETPYGRMKKAVEDEFTGCSCFKSIRLSYVMSSEDKFTKYCLDCIRKNEIAQIFHPFYRNVVSVSDVVALVSWLLQHWNDFDVQKLNVAGAELVSRVRMADELNRILRDKLQYEISTPKGDFYTNRPKITQMKSLYTKAYHMFENTSYTEKVRKELGDITL